MKTKIEISRARALKLIYAYHQVSIIDCRSLLGTYKNYLNDFFEELETKIGTIK